MDAALATAPWLGGEQFGLADAGLISFLHRFEMLGCPWIWIVHSRMSQGGSMPGYFIFLINETRLQTDAVNMAYAARFGAALVDHDVRRLIGG